ncbi:unnamed protein product [Cylicocyclus nassatus]|uniref:BHLH domain-containing protein n=1 Tax=Cylicocyclus nassatus TaxID=53992 RepID=A0AA36MBH2_CYLNA|nr:unnamed protein product [Cylicocyclus nassatus]
MYSDIESFSSDERGHVKKTNKPMMEKKRRARINHCLSELKEILICDKHASAGHAKWEKADILEMTVDYLKKLRALRDSTSPHTTAIPSVTAAESSPSHSKDCSDAISISTTTPSPSSIESTSDGPPTTKRRRTTSPTPPTSQESRSFMAPTPATPLSLSTLPSSARTAPIVSPQIRPPAGFNFMAQHLLALQYQQNLKMATIAPGMLPGMPALHPFAGMTSIPWRTI